MKGVILDCMCEIYFHCKWNLWNVGFIMHFTSTPAPQQSTVEGSEEKQSDPEDGQDQS